MAAILRPLIEGFEGVDIPLARLSSPADLPGSGPTLARRKEANANA